MRQALDQQALLEAARSETARMRVALGQLESDGKVVLRRDQFAKLASLIEMLAARPCCTDPDCFGAHVDGIRFWIPLPEVARAQDEARAQDSLSDNGTHMRRALY